MSVVDGFEKVTRVVLVGTGSTYAEHWADSWEMHLQDDGRTLKLFATGKGHKARQEASEALGRDLVNGMVKANEEERHHVVSPEQGLPHCACGFYPSQDDLPATALDYHVGLLNWMENGYF